MEDLLDPPSNTVAYTKGTELELVDLVPIGADAEGEEDEEEPNELPTTVLRDVSSGRLILPWLVGKMGLQLHVALSPPPSEDDWQYHNGINPARLATSLWYGYRQADRGLVDRIWRAINDTSGHPAFKEELEWLKEDKESPPPFNFITSIVAGNPSTPFEPTSECNYERQLAQQERVRFRFDLEEQRAIKAGEPIPPRPPEPLPPKKWHVLVLSFQNLHAALYVAKRLAFPPGDRLLLKKYETRLLVPQPDVYVSIPAVPGIMTTRIVEAAVWSQLPVWQPGIHYQLTQDAVPHYEEDVDTVLMVPTHVGPIPPPPVALVAEEAMAVATTQEVVPPITVAPEPVIPAPAVTNGPEGLKLVKRAPTVDAVTPDPIDRMLDAEEQVERAYELLTQIALAEPEVVVIPPLPEEPAAAGSPTTVVQSNKTVSKKGDHQLLNKRTVLNITRYLAQSERPYARITSSNREQVVPPVHLWLLTKVEQHMAKGDATKRVWKPPVRKRAGDADAFADAKITPLTKLWGDPTKQDTAAAPKRHRFVPDAEKKKTEEPPVEPPKKKQRLWSDYFPVKK